MRLSSHSPVAAGFTLAVTRAAAAAASVVAVWDGAVGKLDVQEGDRSPASSSLWAARRPLVRRERNSEDMHWTHEGALHVATAVDVGSAMQVGPEANLRELSRPQHWQAKVPSNPTSKAQAMNLVVRGTTKCLNFNRRRIQSGEVGPHTDFAYAKSNACGSIEAKWYTVPDLRHPDYFRIKAVTMNEGCVSELSVGELSTVHLYMSECNSIGNTLGDGQHWTWEEAAPQQYRLVQFGRRRQTSTVSLKCLADEDGAVYFTDCAKKSNFYWEWRVVDED